MGSGVKGKICAEHVCKKGGMGVGVEEIKKAVSKGRVPKEDQTEEAQ